MRFVNHAVLSRIGRQRPPAPMYFARFSAVDRQNLRHRRRQGDALTAHDHASAGPAVGGLKNTASITTATSAAPNGSRKSPWKSVTVLTV